MKDVRAALPLGVACMFAAAIFGFGAEVFAASFFYSGDDGRAQVVLLTRVVVFVALTVMLVIRSGWAGVVVALGAVFGATLIEWTLLPVAFAWAASQAPADVASGIPSGVVRPPYLTWAAGDLLSAAICAVVTRAVQMVLAVRH